MRFLFLLILFIHSAWCRDAHEESSFRDSRAALRKKQLSRYLKPPLNTTWDDSKVADLGITVDDDLKRTLTECYKSRSWRLRVAIPKSLIDAAQPAVKKTKREQASDKEEKTDSECTSTSAGDSPVASASDQDAIKTGMSFLLPHLKTRNYAVRVELAFCLKAICDFDKINHIERGGCSRLAKVFNNLAGELGRTPSGGQKGYLQYTTELYLQQQLRISEGHLSEQERQGRLTAIVDDHLKRLVADLVFSDKETYLTALVGEKL